MSKKTLKVITESNNHYVIQVKGNRKKLKTMLETQLTGQAIDSHTEKSKGHGRHTEWQTKVYKIETERLPEGWESIKSAVEIRKESICTKTKKKTYSKRLYATDWEGKRAEWLHKGIRGHWGIENRLHWVKDVIHNEDKNQVRTRNGPANRSYISTMAINLHRLNGYDSVTDGQAFCMANIKDVVPWINR